MIELNLWGAGKSPTPSTVNPQTVTINEYARMTTCISD